MTDARGRLTLGQPRTPYYSLPLGDGTLMLIPIPHITAPARTNLDYLTRMVRDKLIRLDESALLGTASNGELIAIDPLQGVLIVGRYRHEIFDLLYGKLHELTPMGVNRFTSEVEAAEFGEYKENTWDEWNAAHPDDGLEDDLEPPSFPLTVLVGGDANRTLDRELHRELEQLAASAIDDKHLAELNETMRKAFPGPEAIQRVLISATSSGARFQLVPRTLYCDAHFMVAERASDDVLSAAKWAATRDLEGFDWEQVTVIEANRSDGFTLTDQDHPDGTFVRRDMTPAADYQPIYRIPDEGGQ